MPSVYENQQQVNLQRAKQAAQNAMMQGAKAETAGFVPANTAKPEQQTAPSQGTTAPTTQAAGGYTGYSPSQAVLAAQQYLNQQLANKPGAYVSKYDTQLDSLLSEMMNRGPFTYDASADPLYNIYKDLYIQNGRRAMQDTLGNAAALTGGYGSSYGQSAAQQIYNQYMEGLNSVVPQLQQQAYQRYSDEGDRMAQNFQFMNLLENQNYGRYRDTVSDWQTDRSYAYQAALNAEQMDRQQFQYDTTFRENQRQFDANEAFRQAQLAEQIRQANLDEAYRQQQAAEAVRQYDTDAAYRQAQADLAANQWSQQFAENQRQYDTDAAYRQAQADLAAEQWLQQYEESIRQYNQNFGESQRQFDLEQALAQAKFDLTLRQYEDALAQAAAGSGGGSGGGNTKKSEEEKKNTETPVQADALYYLALPENMRMIAKQEPGYSVLSPNTTKGFTKDEISQLESDMKKLYEISPETRLENAKAKNALLTGKLRTDSYLKGLQSLPQKKADEEAAKRKALLELLK